ncbi:hypothetical protein GCM10017687_37840 [Streptomyces echinatus]
MSKVPVHIPSSPDPLQNAATAVPWRLARKWTESRPLGRILSSAFAVTVPQCSTRRRQTVISAIFLMSAQPSDCEYAGCVHQTRSDCLSRPCMLSWRPDVGVVSTSPLRGWAPW